MGKTKELEKRDLLPDEQDLRLELRLQPVSIDPSRWSERQQLERQWRLLNSLEPPERLH